MNKRSLLLLSVVCGLVSFSSVWASGESQETEHTQIPTFRITSSQVVVDFVAIDKEGRLVTDLGPGEIAIFEDGKKQSIHLFLPPGQLPENEFVRSTSTTPLPASLDPTSPAPDASAGPVSGPAAQTVIVIDSRIMDANNFGHVVAAVRRFVEQHLTAEHSIMIAEINRGLRIITPMTRERTALLAGLDQLKPQTLYNPLAADPGLSSRQIEQYINDLQQQVYYVGNALTSLSYALSGQPERKHVVFLSEGYSLEPLRDLEMSARSRMAGNPDNESRMKASRDIGRQKDPGVLDMVKEVVTTANRFGVSFYTIDARGLVAVPGIGPADRPGDVAASPFADQPVEERVEDAKSANPERGPTELTLAAFARTDVDNLENAQNTLIALAAGTNGTAFYNTNDLTSVLRASTVEQETYYLASYVPSEKRKTGKFHQISVKASRPGVLVRARKGYLDLEDKAFQQGRFSAAFDHPELFQQLSPLAQVEVSKGKIRAVIGVPAPEVSFRLEGTGYHAELVFLGQIYAEDGKAVSKDLAITRGFNLNLTAQQFQGLGLQPLLAQEELKLSRGQYKLVLLVENRLSGRLGATVQHFTVP